MNALFQRLATRVADAAGSAYAFLAAVALVLLWLVTGPLFGFSDTWQLVINTGTTVITFLMVFLIQGAQNRDTDELKALVRELVRAVPEANTAMIDQAKDKPDIKEKP